MSDSSASWKPTVSRSAAYGRERVIQEDLDLPPATQSFFCRSWPSYFRFAEERPSDIAVTGSPRGHSFAASYAYDPVHLGQLFLMTLGWDDYSGVRHVSDFAARRADQPATRASGGMRCVAQDCQALVPAYSSSRRHHLRSRASLLAFS